MMRRGPLDRYSPEWVLRQVAETAASGCIELHAEEPATIYVEHGAIVHAIGEIVPAGGTPEASEQGEEAAARAVVLDVVASALDQATGWYYHDPLGHHRVVGAWRWSVDDVIAGARQRRSQLEAFGAWGARPVEVVAGSGGAVQLGDRAWKVVAALCAASGAPELAERLRWTPDELGRALAELRAAGVLAGHDGDAVDAVPGSEGPKERSTVVVADPGPAPVGPRPERFAGANGSGGPVLAGVSTGAGHRPAVATVPSDSPDRRTALRRLITALRPS